MLRNLTKIANKLDTLGLTKEADLLDSIIQKMAQTTGAPGAKYQAGRQVGEVVGKKKIVFPKSKPKSILELNNFLSGMVKQSGGLIFSPDALESAEKIFNLNTWTPDTNVVWEDFARLARAPEAGRDWASYSIQNGYAPNIDGLFAFYADKVPYVESAANAEIAALEKLQGGQPRTPNAQTSAVAKTPDSPATSGSTGRFQPDPELQRKEYFAAKALEQKGVDPYSKTSSGFEMSKAIAKYEGKKYSGEMLPKLILDDDNSVFQIYLKINEIDNKRRSAKPSGPPPIPKPGTPGLPTP